MKTINNFKHQVASHCESGSIRNLLKYSGVDVSEALVFGIGSGIDFIYLSFLKLFSPFPIIITRSKMGSLFKNIEKTCGIKFYYKKLSTTNKALEIANRKIDSDIPVAVCVDMFYMKYLPSFMHIHVPFHFIVLFGRDEKSYMVSDPYYQNIGNLSIENLKPAMSTHALFSNDNLLVYVEQIPEHINWKKAIISALKKTATKMEPPRFINAFSILGVEAIKLFAKKMLDWPKKFKGLTLREGILFTATGFEEQGTGGGAFRLIYGAFLQEASNIFNSEELGELAYRMVENGKEWRECSRELIKIGKQIPRIDEEYPDWYSKNGNILVDSIKEMSKRYEERSDFEKKLFRDLKKVAGNLKESDH